MLNPIERLGERLLGTLPDSIDERRALLLDIDAAMPLRSETRRKARVLLLQIEEHEKTQREFAFEISNRRPAK